MSSQDASDEDSNSEYEVEMILDKRERVRVGREYLVKWKGWGYEDLTWEPLANLGNCPQLIKEFERSGAARKDCQKAVKETNGKRKRLEEPVAGPSSASTFTSASTNGWMEAKNKKRGAWGGATSARKMTGADYKAPDCRTSSPVATRLHPLLNPLILNSMFEVCSHELLATSRMVCKTWYRESLRFWRASSMLTLVHSKQHDKVRLHLARRVGGCRSYDYDHPANDEEEPCRSTMLPAFLDFFEQNCCSKPYRKFHLHKWQIGLTNDDFQEQGRSGTLLASFINVARQQDRFWELVGPHVTLLILDTCEFRDVTALRKIIFQTFPNMRTLSLRYCTLLHPIEEAEIMIPTQYTPPTCGEHLKLETLSFRGEAPISFIELLSHFTSITNVLFGYVSPNEHIIPLLMSIKTIRNQDDRKLARFKTIESGECGDRGFFLTSEICQERCNVLCGLIQELGDLDLFQELIFDFSCTFGVLKSVLSVAGGTVRKLRAVRTVGTATPCDFQLSNLHTLVISSGFCKNMEFIKWTPNLKRLHLAPNASRNVYRADSHTQMVNNTCELAMRDVKLLKLKELWLGYSVYEENVRELCRWMPNVTILSMVLNDEQFATVCKKWKKLVHIHQLEGSNLSDQGITGKSGDRIRPNITMLKDLHCFQYAGTTCKLTDASVYGGFLKLPKLQNFDIASNDNLISNEGVKALRKKIRNCQVRPAEYKRLSTCRFCDVSGKADFFLQIRNEFIIY